MARQCNSLFIALVQKIRQATGASSNKLRNWVVSQRFGRLTNAFSKKIVKLHKAHRTTPAMAAGLTDKLLDWNNVIEMIDARERETLLHIRQTMLAAE